MTAAQAVSATFTQLYVYALTVTKTGSGSGTLTSSPAGIDCGATCSASFAGGTQVTLTATSASGSVFSGWSGAGCSGTGACVVTMSATQAVSASFTQVYVYALTVTKTGSGSGTVTCSAGGINCGATCSASFAVGSQVTLTATPASGSVFSGWSGAGCSGTGSCLVTMNAAQAVNASFTQLYTLTVTKTGSGGGTVTSSPAGIICGATCSASFVIGTSVTLSAVPASGSVFSGWSGAGCSGTGICVVTMNAAQSVTATFLPNSAQAQTVSFIARGDFAVGTHPKSVAVGDFNGDGRLDLAVANAGSHDVSVLLGNGDGTFQPALTFTAGRGGFFVAGGGGHGGRLGEDNAGLPSLTYFVFR